MLNNITIKAQVKAAFKASQTKEPDVALDYISEQLTTIIIDAIKSATITVPPLTFSQGATTGVVMNPAPVPLTNALS